MVSTNQDSSEFTIDQRLHTIKDTIDKWCYDYWVPPQTVSTRAETYLAEEQETMKLILEDIEKAKQAFVEVQELLEKTQAFCEDLDVEIQKAYAQVGLEIPNEFELYGEEEPEQKEEEGDKSEENDENAKDNEKSEYNANVTFYEPTPAKPSQSKKLF